MFVGGGESAPSSLPPKAFDGWEGRAAGVPFGGFFV